MIESFHVIRARLDQLDGHLDRVLQALVDDFGLAAAATRVQLAAAVGILHRGAAAGGRLWPAPRSGQPDGEAGRRGRGSKREGAGGAGGSGE